MDGFIFLLDYIVFLSPALSQVQLHSMKQSNSASAVIMKYYMCTDMQQAVYSLTSSSPAFAAVVSGASGSPPSAILPVAGGVGSCPVSSDAGTGLQLLLPPTVAGYPQLMACTLGRCPDISRPAVPDCAFHQAACRDE